jgi:hypothetical protein
LKIRFPLFAVIVPDSPPAQLSVSLQVLHVRFASTCVRSGAQPVSNSRSRGDCRRIELILSSELKPGS